jgi:hypothetical protein
VKLIEPALKGANNNNIKMNKLNNLEFDLEIASGKTEEITIKYSVEHAVDHDVEFF